MVYYDDNQCDFITSLGKMSYNVNAIAHEHGWWEGDRNDGEIIALIHSELSEALEGLRTDVESDKISGYLAVEEELADVVIRIMDYAHERGYRLAKAILAKVDYNNTRPYKHGGKKF